VATFLKARGYDVTVASGVGDALRRAAEGFDVVISDIGLPDGSGHDLMRQLASERRVRAIALSGYGAESDVERSTAAGFERHLTKPVDPERLVDAIESLVAPAR
jgi:CheY-like chemotaxis protein